jgi:hypothetical protein
MFKLEDSFNFESLSDFLTFRFQSNTKQIRHQFYLRLFSITTTKGFLYFRAINFPVFRRYLRKFFGRTFVAEKI